MTYISNMEICAMLAYILWSKFFIATIHGRELTGPHVCENSSIGVRYCCFNHEPLNGKCIPCSDGYSSRDGHPCKPCEEGYYGIRCLFKCQCKGDERCDHMHGCVDVNISIVSTELFVTQIIEITRLTTENQIADQKPSNNSDKELKIMINAVEFGIACGVIFVYFIVIHTLCFIMYKQKNDNRNIIMTRNVYDEIGTVHYDAVTIQPIVISQSAPDVTASLTSLPNDDVHLNTDIDPDITDISSESQDGLVVDATEDSLANEQVTDGYEHPYTPLCPRNFNDHQYNDWLISNERTVSESPQNDNERPLDDITLQV